jgi:hypothetical protein
MVGPVITVSVNDWVASDPNPFVALTTNVYGELATSELEGDQVIVPVVVLPDEVCVSTALTGKLPLKIETVGAGDPVAVKLKVELTPTAKLLVVVAFANAGG